MPAGGRGAKRSRTRGARASHRLGNELIRAIFRSGMTLADHPRIAIDPAICGGRPTIRGTRMRVTDILEALAEGVSEEQLVADFPYVTLEDIRACLAYAAAMAEEPLRRIRTLQRL
jgi:uncharacterized protein (DUF433 family)